MPSCLPISESENQNTDQLVLHGHGPITQISDLSKRLITGYHTGTGQISPLPKTVFLAGNRQEQQYGSGRLSWEAGNKIAVQSSFYLRLVPP